MLCDECKKNQATYHSISKINGVSTQKHLCHECHSRQSQQSYSSIGNLFAGFNSLFEPRRTVQRCSKCGTSSEEFLNSGYVGCPDCYSELATVVMPVVQKVQDASRHTGKSPFEKGIASSNNQSDLQAEYMALKSELERAIATENYEQATIIRDKMKQLREQ